MDIEKMSLKQARKMFGEDFCKHPNVVIAEYGDPCPFLQSLAKILNSYGLKLVEIDAKWSDIPLVVETK